MLNYIKLIKEKLYKLLEKKNSVCYIEEIDVINETAMIRCRGIMMPIKFTFIELIQDIVMISNLLPQHASLIGYYYGKSYHNLSRVKYNCNKANNFEFLFRDSAKRYKILYQSRNGKISYLDKVNMTTHARLSVDIISKHNLINEFDSIEACYIGILGGILVSKNNNRIKAKNSSQPSLRLVN